MNAFTPSSGLRSEVVWTDDEPLSCCSVVPEAADTATFCFVSPSGRLFRYLPGQFITLELPVPGGTLYKTYTISSSPSRPMTISVTVKAQKDSIGTRWMLDNLRPGMKIKAKGPAGIFTLPEEPRGKYLFVTAGSGVTPALSMTTYLFDRGWHSDAVLIHCARRPSEIICREILEQMAVRVPFIKLHFIVEQEDPFEIWTGYRGQLNQLMLGLIANDYLEREIYCCGPEPFMVAVRGILNALGFDMAHYNQESFAAPVKTDDDAIIADDHKPADTKDAELVFVESNVTQPCTEIDTILGVAKVAGLNIPSGCTFGVCGTCRIKKRSGEVHMVHNGGISDEEIEEGYILACCSKPIGRVEIEV